jgi:hypothetical protein
MTVEVKEKIWWCQIGGQAVPIKNLTWRELADLLDHLHYAVDFSPGHTALMVEANTRLIRMGCEPDYRSTRDRLRSPKDHPHSPPLQSNYHSQS